MGRKLLVSPYLDICKLPNNKYSVFNKNTKKTFFIGEFEYSVLDRLDGSSNIIEELCDEFEDISHEKINQLIECFAGLGFLADDKEKKRKQKFYRLTIAVFNPNKLFKYKGAITEILAFVLIYLSIPLFVLGLILSADDIVKHYGAIINGFSAFNIIYILLIAVITLFLHEMSHVVVSRKFGATIPEMGIILYWFMPGAFVNLSSIACIPRRINRIKVYMAGIFFNLALSGASLILCKIVGVNFYLLWIAIDNIFNVFMNLLIFLKLDGYLVFKELVGEVYLYEEAISYTKNKIASFIRNISRKKDAKFHNIRTKNDKEALDDGFKKVFGFISMSFIPVLVVTMVFSVILVIAEHLM